MYVCMDSGVKRHSSPGTGPKNRYKKKVIEGLLTRYIEYVAETMIRYAISLYLEEELMFNAYNVRKCPIC